MTIIRKNLFLTGIFFVFPDKHKKRVMRKDLEKRLINFAILILEISRRMEDDYSSTIMIHQMIRSGSSSALNYGEAQAAESQKDFVHKSSVILKELRETQINLQIVSGAGLCKDKALMDQALDEAGQLVAIFQKTVMTARAKL
jgi:four helix bundle protein